METREYSEKTMQVITKTQRDPSIDALRAIAVIGIILVHVGPPSLIEQIRDYDVPMMVFLSGVVYAMTCHPQSGGGKFNYSSFLWKRFVRLIAPTWLFLTILVALSYILHRPMRMDTMIDLYTLQTQWYVWIIRVFFIISIISPFIGNIVLRSSKLFLLSGIVFLVVMVELIYNLSGNFTYKLMCIQIPYIAVFGLGCGIEKFTKKELLAFSLICIFGYAIYAVVLYSLIGIYVPTGAQKYPPRTYYLLYAIGVVILLWRFRNILFKLFDDIKISGFMSFIGSHSLWIYFWHIAGLIIIERFNMPFFLDFMIILAISLMLTFFQCLAIDKLTSSINNYQLKKYLVIIFKS